MKCIMFCKFIGGETTHHRCLVILIVSDITRLNHHGLSVRFYSMIIKLAKKCQSMVQFYCEKYEIAACFYCEKYEIAACSNNFNVVKSHAVTIITVTQMHFHANLID